MKSTPIIFSGPMIAAILAGRKTQTRRIVRNQPFESEHRKGEWLRPCGRNTWASNLRCEETYKHGSSVVLSSREYFEPFEDWMMEVCPYAVGDELWVRESIGWDTSNKLHSYTADGAALSNLGSLKPRSCPSIHMPRWASRISLTVAERRIEQLCGISESDAKAEGIEPWREPFGSDVDPQWTDPNYRAAFSMLWDGIHGDEAWKRNPWVWAITFAVKENHVLTEFAKSLAGAGVRQ